MSAQQLHELSTCQRDLDLAEEAIQRMADASDMHSLEASWQDFLHRVERAWEVAQRVLQPRKGFQQWFSPYAKLKRGDPLLKFIDHARDSEMHGISSTMERPFHLQLSDRLGRPFKVDSMQIELDNGTMKIDIKTPDGFLDYQASILPTTPRLTRFKNRGNWYNAPSSHLGRPITDLHPVIAAKLTLEFYRSYLRDASSYFGEKPGQKLR